LRPSQIGILTCLGDSAGLGAGLGFGSRRRQTILVIGHDVAATNRPFWPVPERAAPPLLESHDYPRLRFFFGFCPPGRRCFRPVNRTLDQRAHRAEDLPTLRYVHPFLTHKGKAFEFLWLSFSDFDAKFTPKFLGGLSPGHPYPTQQLIPFVHVGRNDRE
jgi:hypothetical protein